MANGFDNDTMFAANVDFTGNSTVSPQMLVNGQLLIGSTAAPHIRVATLSSTGGTILITNGAGSINLESVAVGFSWTDVTGTTQALAINHGYVTDNGSNVTYTLPATAALGDEIKIVGKLGLTIVAQNANQQILMSSASSTVGVTGSITGTNVGDCVDLICITSGASTVWRSANFVGNWTVA